MLCRRSFCIHWRIPFLGVLCLAATGPATAATATAKLDLTGFIAAIDKNHDGCVSNDEWFGAGLPKSAHDGLVDAAGCVTLAAMQAGSPPDGIDVNGDGKLTLEEFLAFDRQASAGKPAPDPAPPHSN